MKRLPKLASLDDCFGCMLCHDVCPVDAISMRLEKNGYWMPHVNDKACIGCLTCERNCKKIQSSKPDRVTKTPLRGFCTDDAIREKSASGGAFASIACSLIHKYRAVVYGATLNNDNVYHLGIEKTEEIDRLQGSKYIQSETTGVYKGVKDNLLDGRFVVFSGTPCQVQALKLYLGKDYDNLITIDLICHGVVSHQLLFRHKTLNRIKNITAFRAKNLGWGQDCFFKYKDGRDEFTESDWSKNFFYHAFQLEACCRPSCYKCPFSQTKRVSDITLGDYWTDRRGERYDPLGISSILPNTAKGRNVVATCENLETESVDWLSTIRPNPRLFTSRVEFLKFACSKHIFSLYKYLPSFIADCIIGVRNSKRHILFRPWLKYISHVKAEYEMRYQAELSKLSQ